MRARARRVLELHFFVFEARGRDLTQIFDGVIGVFLTGVIGSSGFPSIQYSMSKEQSMI